MIERIGGLEGRTDVCDTGISMLGRMLRAHEVSPVELTRAFLDRIDALNLVYRSYVVVAHEAALESARRAEQEIMRDQWRGPMHGVPIALKDLVCTKDLPTTGGSPVFAEIHTGYDAALVERLRAAGAILLGKLATTEGAFFAHHSTVAPPKNPWGADLWTGASSSGPAVAVAAGLCAGAIGSDTGGSIRIPAACCNVTGLKPTFGRVSRYGVIPLSESLDHVGPIARSAADVAVLLRVIAGYDPRDPSTLAEPMPDCPEGIVGTVSGVRIGIDEGFVTRGVEHDVAAAFRATREALKALGCVSHPISFPPLGAAMRAWSHICMSEAGAAHGSLYPAHRDFYGPALARFLETARNLSEFDIMHAVSERQRFSAELDTMLSEIDVVLLPTMPIVAPSLKEIDRLFAAGEIDRINHFTQIFNLTGHPTISFPAGISTRGQPIGMQLIGRRSAERDLLRVAHALQSATDWHRRRPPLPCDCHA